MTTNDDTQRATASQPEDANPVPQGETETHETQEKHPDEGLLAGSIRLVEELFRKADILKAPPEFAEKVIAAIHETQEKSPLLKWLRKRFKLPW
ncbi:MAG TPA: hypothetical protein PLD47_17860 [Aggregatilineales bacterium]|nr:hypothetical protein [Anaerolineales bacterium]HRE49594.1 hypothetical protein [Aggregatilineales bacterium]